MFKFPATGAIVLHDLGCSIWQNGVATKSDHVQGILSSDTGRLISDMPLGPEAAARYGGPLLSISPCRSARYSQEPVANAHIGVGKQGR